MTIFIFLPIVFYVKSDLWQCYMGNMDLEPHLRVENKSHPQRPLGK